MTRDQRNPVILILALLALALVGATGCATSDNANASTGAEGSGAQTASNVDGEDPGADSGKNDGEADDEEAVPVEVTTLERGPIESVLRFSSNLEAEKQVKVYAQSKRLVLRRLVEEGDRVRENQLLLRLQDDEQQSALAKVRSQLDKAEREYERKQRLFAQELISEQEFNDATHELDQLRIELSDAQRELSYTEVRAPISGTITARMVNLGDQVSIGQELFEIIDFDSLVARVFVPEKHLERLRRGLTARLSAQTTTDRSYRAAVERIAPVVDPRSGTVKVTVNVGGQPGLRPGMYVDVDLVVATNEQAVRIPKRALIYDNDQMFVFRLADERRVERVFVEPQLTDKYFVEPSAGIEAGDQLVVAGQAGLKDGALVELPGDRDEARMTDEVEPAIEQARL